MPLGTPVSGRLLLAALVLSAVAAPIVLRGQPNGDYRTGGWSAPQTPWGEPDLQGRWPVTHLMGTPLQRDEALGIKRFYTAEEMAARSSRAERAYRAAHPNEPRTPPAPR